MADKTVQIDIKTTADTTGATKATQAVTAVSTAAAGTANSMRGMNMFATQAGYQFTDFAVQVQGGTSAITAFSQQFPQLIGAAQQSGIEFGKMSGGIMSMAVGMSGAITAGAVTAGIAVKVLADAWGNVNTAIKMADDSIKRILNIEKEREEFKAKMARNRYDEWFEQALKAQNALLKSQIDSLRQRDRLLASKETADAASAKADAGGATGADGVASSVEAKIAAVDRSVATEREIWATLHQASLDAAKAAEDADRLATAAEISWEVANKVIDAAEPAAQAAADQAVKLDEIQRTAEDQKQIILAGAREEFSALGQQTSEEITGQAQALQTRIAALAPAAFSQAKTGLDELGKILADGEVKGAAEMALLRDAMNRIRGSQESRDGQVMSTLSSLETLNATLTQKLSAMNDRVRFMEEKIRSLK